MNLATAWKLARAETRRSWGRLSICIAAVALGVFALTLVRAISASVDRSLSGQARQTMGADLTLSASQPLEQTTAKALTEDLHSRGARSANQTRFYSMLSRRGETDQKSTQLVRVRAIGSGFPFYGSIETIPEGRFERLGEEPQVILDRQIAQRLRLKVGDSVKLGELTLTVAGQFIAKPGSPAAGFSLAPSLYLHERYLSETQLLETGSRVRYERHFALPPEVDAETWERRHEGESKREGADRLRITTAEEDNDNVQRFLDRLSGFLTVVAMVTLLLGAVGIGSSMRAFMRDKLDHAAIFRVIGVTRRGVFAIYGLMALWIAALGCALGAVTGVLFPLAIESTLRGLGEGFLPDGLTLSLQPGAAAFGVMAGLLSTVAFTLAPILQTALASPLRILRRNVESVDARRATRNALLVSALCVLAVGALVLSASDGGMRRVGTSFVLAVALCSVALWILASVMIGAARWLAKRVGSYAIRQGIANLHRPGNQTKGVVVAVGLGVLLLTAMFILQHSLQTAMSLDLNRQLPNLFIIDMQTDQVDEVIGLIEDQGATNIDESPMISARIAAINESPLSDDERAREDASENESNEGGRSQRMRTREYFVSYRPELIESETVSAGRFWKGTPARQEASVDAELAEVLDLKIGDTLTLNIQGLPLDAVVTSFREIHWQAVRPNSLILLSPGEIEQAPRQHVASFRIADSRRYDVQSRLIEQFPNLTVIDVTEAAKTIKLIIERVSVVFRGLGTLAIMAGILILSGAVASGRYARQRESMLLKVVGAKRSTLRKILITEQIALSSFGTLAGWLLAEILSRGLWPLFFDVPIFVRYALVLPFLLFTVLLSSALGAIVSRKVSNRPALEILREE